MALSASGAILARGEIRLHKAASITYIQRMKNWTIRLAAALLGPMVAGYALLSCGDSVDPEPLSNKVTMPTNIVVTAGEHFTVPIEFENSEPITAIAVPLNYPRSVLRCDSVSTIGSRCEKFLIKQAAAQGDTILIGLIDTVGIPTGRGLLATIHFWALGNAPDTDVVIDLFVTPHLDFGFADTSLLFGDITPAFRAGRVRINSVL